MVIEIRKTAVNGRVCKNATWVQSSSGPQDTVDAIVDLLAKFRYSTKLGWEFYDDNISEWVLWTGGQE